MQIGSKIKTIALQEWNSFMDSQVELQFNSEFNRTSNCIACINPAERADQIAGVFDLDLLTNSNLFSVTHNTSCLKTVIVSLLYWQRPSLSPLPSSPRANNPQSNDPISDQIDNRKN